MSFYGMLTLVLLVFFPPAFPQGGAGTSGGNGGGGEILFHSISIRVSRWLNENLKDGTLTEKLHLTEGALDPSKLVRLYESAVKKTNVKFIPENRLESECQVKKDQFACELKKTSRICINVNSPKSVIECNEDRFNSERPDVQFAIVFHEYLGVAQIEENSPESYSRYPLSKYLLVEKARNGKCRNERISIIEELFSEIKPASNQDALSLRCYGGQENPDGSFRISSISDEMARRTRMATVLEQDELTRFCASFSFKSMRLEERKSEGVLIRKKNLALYREKLRNKSTLWHHSGSFLYPVTMMQCLK